MNNQTNNQMNGDDFFETAINVESTTEEEVVLTTSAELHEQAEQIKESSKDDTKFPFVLHYDPNQKDSLLSMLGAVGAVVESDDENGHKLSLKANMKQLAFIKKLDSIKRVSSHEGSNPFLADTSVQSGAAQAVPRSVDGNMTADATVMSMNADDGIATASVTDECCPPTTNDTMATAMTVNVGGSANGNITCQGAEQWFKFTTTEAVRHTIYTEGSLDTVGALYNAAGTLITEVDDYEPCGKINFRIIRTLEANRTYFVKVTLNNNATGTYKLKVTTNNLVAEVEITGLDSDGILRLDPGKTYEMPRGDGYAFQDVPGTERAPVGVRVYPSEANNKEVYWMFSSEDGIANVLFEHNPPQGYEVYQKLTITGDGKGCLRAYDGYDHGRPANCTVYVIETPVTEIRLNKPYLPLVIGEMWELFPTLLPENASIKDVAWSSADPNIATVENGIVTGISAGTTKIYARPMDRYGCVAECEVVVRIPHYVRVNTGNGSNLNVMESADANSTVVGQFANHKEIVLYEETPQNEKWYYVYGQKVDGTYTYGWCSGEYLQTQVEFIKSKYSGTLYVRPEPNTNYERLGYIVKDERVRLLEKDIQEENSTRVWNKIEYLGIEAYVVEDGDFDDCTDWAYLIEGKSGFDQFLEGLAQLESSGNYSKVSPSGSYIGRYQMGADALTDAGFKENGVWTELAEFYGITNNASFLSSPQGQEVAIRLFHAELWKQLVNYGAESIIGDSYIGVTITKSGLLAAAHLVGALGVMNAIERNVEISDANGTKAKSYMAELAGYDISEIVHKK